MTQQSPASLIHLGDLGKPANTLIKKISDAVGTLYEPRHVRRIAKAKADAALVEAQSTIEITELHTRAARRWIEEEAQRQSNMEAIATKALPELKEEADPEAIDDDWIVNFFDKCRIVSDDEMQQLWSRVLAGEGNVPGSFSRRTVNLLSDLEKSEAERFASLCGFSWTIGRGTEVPLVFDVEEEIYKKRGIHFNVLSHLDSIGLVRFDAIGSFVRKRLRGRAAVFYHGRSLILEFPEDRDGQLDIGTVLLTSVGLELARICESRPVEGFWEYVQERWKGHLPGVKPE